jgi:DNA-binding response OmpR family regulator
MHVNELDENDKKDIDLIIVDGKMMTISPIQLIYELRYIHKITSAIWMFTIIDIPDYLEKVIEVGANKTIQKPFDPEEITNDIIAYIQTHSLKSTNNKRNI